MYFSAQTISIHIAFVRTAIAQLSFKSGELEALLQQCRIPPALLEEPQARVSLRQFGQLTSVLMAHSDDELLGYGREPVAIGSFAILAHWLVACDNIDHALKRLKLYYKVLGKGLAIDVVERGEQVEILVAPDYFSPKDQAYGYEFGFFFIHRALCWLVQDVVKISQLNFPFEQPDYAKDYRQMFYGAPTAFGQAQASIVFPKALVERPVRRNSSHLAELLDQPFERLLVLNFEDSSWSSKVSQGIQRHLPHLPGLPELAQELGIAPYTLQRRLAQEGLSYLAIKNQVKRDLAIELLVHSRQSIESISAQLGFSETSPFTRTFKDWTGVAPSAYRKQQAQL